MVVEGGLLGIEAALAGHFGYVVAVDRFGLGTEMRRRGDVIVPDFDALKPATMETRV